MKTLSFGFWITFFLRLAIIVFVGGSIGVYVGPMFGQGLIGLAIAFSLWSVIAITAIYFPIVLFVPRKPGRSDPESRSREQNTEMKLWISIDIVCAWILLVALIIYGQRNYSGARDALIYPTSGPSSTFSAVSD